MVFWSSYSIISTCCVDSILHRHMLFTFLYMFLISKLRYFYSKCVSNCINILEVAWFESFSKCNRGQKLCFVPLLLQAAKQQVAFNKSCCAWERKIYIFHCNTGGPRISWFLVPKGYHEIWGSRILKPFLVLNPKLGP